MVINFAVENSEEFWSHLLIANLEASEANRLEPTFSALCEGNWLRPTVMTALLHLV